MSDRRLRVDPREGALRRVAVEHEPAGQLGRQPPEQQVRVGDGRPAARAIAGGPGMRARTLGTDTDRAAGVDANE